MNDNSRKTGVVGILITGVLSICLLSISWLLTIWFEKIRADEPVVFGSLALLLLVMLAFIFFEWRRHRSVWIGTIQGAVLSASLAIPLFRGEPALEPLTGPLIIALFGGVLAAIEAGFLTMTKRYRIICAVTIIVLAAVCATIGIFASRKNTRHGMFIYLYNRSSASVSVYVDDQLYGSLRPEKKGKYMQPDIGNHHYISIRNDDTEAEVGQKRTPKMSGLYVLMEVHGIIDDNHVSWKLKGGSIRP